MNKKEYTRSIVSNIQNKISEFKHRKAQEQHDRKNELDFEINHDLVNQFKKNKNTQLKADEREVNDENDYHQPSTKLNNRNRLDLSDHSHDIYATKKGEYSLGSGNNQMNNKEQSQGVRNYPEENNRAKYVNNYNNHHHSQQSIDHRKQDMINSLFNKVMNNHTVNANANSNLSGIGHRHVNHNDNDRRTKDKIKSMITQFEEPKRIPKNNTKITRQAITPIGSSIKQNQTIISMYNHNNHLHNQHQHNHHNQNYLSLYATNNNNNKSNHALDVYSDFSMKHNDHDRPRTSSSNPFNSNHNHTSNRNHNEQIYQSAIPQKSICPIKTNEIRPIANKIRFLSTEELRSLDRNVIEELSNLRSILNRLFDNKLR